MGVAFETWFAKEQVTEERNLGFENIWPTLKTRHYKQLTKKRTYREWSVAQ